MYGIGLLLLGAWLRSFTLYEQDAYMYRSSSIGTTVNTFLISNFRRVLYVVYFLLGNSPASKFYITKFMKTLYVPS
jgi:hypothetical protein